MLTNMTCEVYQLQVVRWSILWATASSPRSSPSSLAILEVPLCSQIVIHMRKALIALDQAGQGMARRGHVSAENSH